MQLIHRRTHFRSLPVGWQADVAISSIGDTIVSTVGTLIKAINSGSTTAKTVNGVTFASGSLNPTGYEGDATAATFYQDGGVSADFETVLDSFVYGDISMNNTFTLSGLTSGKKYLVQFFISDDRSSGSGTYYMTLGGYTSTTRRLDASLSRTCVFVASGTTQSVVVVNSAYRNVINAYQIRQLD